MESKPMTTTSTPLQERVAQLFDPYQGEEGANAVKILADEVGKVERDAVEAERLHIENMNLRRANERLRKQVARFTDFLTGARAQKLAQQGKDLS